MKLAEVFQARRPGPTLRRPCLVAEAGVNHEGRMELAERLIDEAREGGADAVKFQTYRADTIACRESPSYWDTTKEPTRSQHELFRRYDKFWKKEFERLKKHCEDAHIEFLSTPFDLESADFLNDLMDVFKISSSDITNRPFIEHICGFRKPILLSTGASHPEEIDEAVGWVQACGNPLALLHCVLNYPTADENAHLGMILDLRRRFPELPVGYSDHTLPADMRSLEVATLLGAEILEKHFTFDKTLPGNDHYHAMDKEDIKAFLRSIARDFTLLGRFSKDALPSEEPARRNARRSLVAARRIAKGRRITAEDLTWKRPARGISPKHLAEVSGRVAAEDIEEDTALQWDMLA